MNRRGFLIGASAILAAPSIVRVSSLMPVSVVDHRASLAAFADAVGFGPLQPWQAALLRAIQEDVFRIALAFPRIPRDPVA